MTLSNKTLHLLFESAGRGCGVISAEDANFTRTMPTADGNLAELVVSAFLEESPVLAMRTFRQWLWTANKLLLEDIPALTLEDALVQLEPRLDGLSTTQRSELASLIRQHIDD